MKINIKHKLAGAFILVIFLPIASAAIIFHIATFLLQNDTDVNTGKTLSALAEGIADSMNKNFANIDDYDFIHKLVAPSLDKYNARLQVVDLSNTILFDSENRVASLQKQAYKPGAHGREIDLDKRLEADVNGLLTLTSPVAFDGRQAGTAYITLSGISISKNVNTKILLFVASLYLLPLLVIILLIYLLTRRISGDILIPLKELNASAEKIVQGNLDFKINYNKDNELGRFCQVFDAMREKLSQSLEQREAYEYSRKKLLAAISHDLRTPISSIKAYVEGLQDGIVKDKAKFDRYLSVIKSKAESLDSLIDDLFQYSQLELEKLDIQLCGQNSRRMLEEILTPLKLELDGSDIDFILSEPIPDVTINADRRRMEQVLNNLIQNARQYGSTGGKIVFAAGVEGGSLLVSIRDYGQGIPEDDLPLLFEGFYRGEKSRSRLYGGAGLGLSICKHIVEQHGGKIWAESTPGEGSTFYFTLPVAMGMGSASLSSITASI